MSKRASRLKLTVEREQREWTRAELARRAGMNPGTVGLIENSRLVPYGSQLKKLAKALGWKGNPQDLLVGASDE